MTHRIGYPDEFIPAGPNTSTLGRVRLNAGRYCRECEANCIRRYAGSSLCKRRIIVRMRLDQLLVEKELSTSRQSQRGYPVKMRLRRWLSRYKTQPQCVSTCCCGG